VADHFLLIVTHGVACDAISTRILGMNWSRFMAIRQRASRKTAAPVRRYPGIGEACTASELRQNNSNTGLNAEGRARMLDLPADRPARAPERCPERAGDSRCRRKCPRRLKLEQAGGLHALWFARAFQTLLSLIPALLT